MQYSYVYIDGKYSIRSERGDYACTPTAYGLRRRRWATAAAAERWITGAFITHCSGHVWGLSDAVVQAKPGQSSIAHRTVVAGEYKPAHGGYPEARATWRTKSFAHPYGSAWATGIEEEQVGLDDASRFGRLFVDRLPLRPSGTVTGRMQNDGGNLSEMLKAALWPAFAAARGNEEATTVPTSLVAEMSKSPPPSTGEVTMQRTITKLQQRIDALVVSRDWWQKLASINPNF